MSLVGKEYDLDIERVAHGGICVGRLDGRAVFVRHTLPGERVRVVITDGSDTDRFLRADAIDVIRPSKDRVDAPCIYAAPGACGGCDWQHVAVAAQRGLKASVVREQLSRLAGLNRDVVVEELPGSADGLHWRTRVRFAVDAAGTAGLRQSRSHDVVPIEDCLLAAREANVADVLAREWSGYDAVSVAVGNTDTERSVLAEADDASDPILIEGPAAIANEVADRRWIARADGFWQVHPAAAQTFVDVVLDVLNPQPGESALDLYAGVGLFAGAVADRVGISGNVTAVEAFGPACADARNNLFDLGQVRIDHARVDAWIRRRPVGEHVDLVVLDPPRKGAKAPVVAGIAALSPRAVAYVACDPAALARDVALFATHGYDLTSLRAFDAFPMTHHVECIAGFERV